jgi:tetratricopeptide (TPR) repeat protein
MKPKHLLLAAALGMSGLTYAQSSKVISTWNYINYYNSGEGAENLEKAKAAIDEASVNEATMASGKTWWYRAQVHQLILSDTSLNKKYPTALSEALASFKKLGELNDSRFKDWNEVLKYLGALGAISFNGAVDAFKSKDYKTAYQGFYAIKDINTLIASRGGKPAIDMVAAMTNAAMAAEAAEDFQGAITIYKDMIQTAPDIKYYRLLAALYKNSKQIENQKKTLEEGIAKYPENIDIKIDMLNVFIAEDKHDQAIGMMKDAIALDPKNDQLHYALGTAYDKIGKVDEAKDAYLKSAEINPKNFNAYYNLGALYFNQAGKINEKINELGYSKEDKAKEVELKKQRAELFLKAKPYFEQAKALDAQDQAVNKALKQIELYGNQ